MNKIVLIIGIILCIAACQAPQNSGEFPDSNSEGETGIAETAADEQGVEIWEMDFQTQRLIGDLLYDALVALQQDRLLTPVDNNAHSRYQRVLAYDPGNALAQEGLKNIVNRYLDLAAEASRQGRYETAQISLERASFVDAEDPAITEAWLSLQAERQSGDLVVELNLAELRSRSPALQARLADLAKQAQQQEAFVLVTAPDDEQARWIFTVMRESVIGYRLRGNIERGSHATVRLRSSAR